MTSRIFIMPTFFKFITSQRGAQQILDSDGYIYSQKKSRDTALTSTKYNPPTKCKCHIYLVPSRQLPHSGYTAPQPLCISNMPKLLPLRTSSYLPPAPRHAEKSPSSSTTGRLRGVLNGMTNADGKSNKSNKTNTRQAERKKVIKSPVKTSSTQNEGEDDKNYCPCKEYMDGELSVGCENCGEYWHLCCVGLKGLTMEMVGLLENWQCQDCYVCPYSYKEKVAAAPSTSDCGTMRVMVRDELHAIQPVIKVTVENVVRNLLTKSACSKDDLKEVVKSYADVTKECQKEIVKEAAMTQSSKTVVENVVRKLDADKVEREKRRTNVVVLKAPEP
ncbi:hypothetical protein ACHWQZ_G016669 [Mnemiopsis leidyi]